MKASQNPNVREQMERLWDLQQNFRDATQDPASSDSEEAGTATGGPGGVGVEGPDGFALLKDKSEWHPSTSLKPVAGTAPMVEQGIAAHDGRPAPNRASAPHLPHHFCARRKQCPTRHCEHCAQTSTEESP